MELLKSLVDKIKVQIIDRIKAQLKKIIVIVIIVLVALLSWKGCRMLQKKQDSAAESTVLGPDERGKIIVDPVKHKITTVTRNSDGTTRSKDTYLPDRPSVITEDNNGKVTVVTRKFGTEVRPYVGIGGALDGTARAHFGSDLWYYKKLDLGLGLDLNAGVFKELSAFRDTRLSANASYNIYSNTSLALSFDNHKVVGLFLKVRI